MSKRNISSANRATAFIATLALCSLILLVLSPSAFAAAPQVRTQAPGYYRIALGDFEVTALNDGTVQLDVAKLLKESQLKTEAALGKSFLNTPLDTSVNAYLVNTGEKLVLIDTGGGSLFGKPLGRLLANLAAAGYQAGQVDDVLITHLHPDHVGGLMSHDGMAFPNATIHADKRDIDFWLSQKNLDQAPAESKGFFQGAMASLNPYVAAGKLQPFETDREIVPGVRSMSTYGHTVGHTSYLVQSKGHTLMVIGDLIHVAPVQLANPTVTIAFDSDPSAAAATRQKVFLRAATDRDLVGAAHLQFPGLGHLRKFGKSWQWIPVNYVQEPQ